MHEFSSSTSALYASCNAVAQNLTRLRKLGSGSVKAQDPEDEAAPLDPVIDPLLDPFLEVRCALSDCMTTADQGHNCTLNYAFLCNAACVLCAMDDAHPGMCGG